MKAPAALLIFFVLSIPSVEAVSSSPPWLIATSEGSLLTYNGSNFSYVGNLGKGNYYVRGSGGFWLVRKQGLGEPEVFMFDGVNLVNLTQRVAKLLAKRNSSKIYQASCGEDSCLITSRNAVVEFNGSAAVADSAPPGIQLHWLRPLPSWNGSTWLMGGYREGAPVLLQYNGREWREIGLTGQSGMKGEIRDISWNGEYWLICAYLYSEKSGLLPKLFKYDGHDLVEIRLPGGIFEKEHESVDTPDTAVWDGENWIIGLKRNSAIFSKLLKFDGRSFEVLYDVGGKAHPLTTDAMKLDIKCGSDECLVYFGSMRHMGLLAKVKGKELQIYEDIPGFKSLLRDFDWNGKYWLVAEYFTYERTTLLKYNGSKFVDITQALISAASEYPDWVVFSPLMKAEAYGKVKPGEPAKAQPPERKPLCGPTAILLVTILVAVFVHRKRTL